MPKNQPRINEAKRKQVEKLKELFRKYPVIGVADLTSLPSRQLQSIRKKLKKELLIRNFKKRFIIIAAVEQGKIAIKKDKVLAKEGEEISAKAAELLAKIGVEPISICLNVLVFYDKGTLYKKDVLDVDEAEYIRRLVLAYREALSLSVSIEYPTKDNVSK